MNTKTKYLSYGSILIISLIIIVQLTVGYAGIILVPLVRFVYYGLILSFNVPLVFQIAFLAGIFAVISRVVKLNIVLKPFNYLPYFSLIQPSQSIIKQNGSQNLLKPIAKPGTSLNHHNNFENQLLDTEQGMILVSSGTVLFADKAFFKITGLKPFEVLGKDFSTLIDPGSLIHYTALNRNSHANRATDQVIRLISRSKDVSCICFFSNEQNYNFEGINLFKTKQIRETVKSDLSITELFFNAIENQDAINLIWDDKGILYLNSKIRSNMPIPFSRMINNSGLLLALVHKKDRNRTRKAFESFLQTNKFKEDLCCRLSGNDARYYRVSIVKQSINGFFSKGYHAFAYDITEDKLAITSAQNEVEKAERANKNKTDFLTNMSHEIRSPLNGIIGFSELLADTNLTEDERERYLTIIQNNGTALITLLSDMIDISKLESEKLTLANYKFIPHQIVEDLKSQFSGTSSGVSGKVKMIFPKFNPDSSLEIESDPNRLRQILINLITNAIKFTHEGFIEIGIDSVNDEMLFWVRDTGIGIPVENQKTIFERFRQVDPNLPSPILGFGLGLAISKALVELLGGHLWVESIPDQGSLFVFTIKTNIITNTMETNQFNINSYPVDFSNRTILIAEDIDFSFLYIEAVLRRTGAKILWAQNGKEAVDHVTANQHIDLVLMDMHMPVMSGYDATKIITETRPGLPVIAQTAFVLPADVKKCFASGCSGFLAKPIRKEQLLNTLSEYFDKMDHQEMEQHSYKVNVG